ncbi:MAG TPA: hypothetical protein VII61_04105 [Ktedonobacteraceae bacterium]
MYAFSFVRFIRITIHLDTGVGGQHTPLRQCPAYHTKTAQVN